MRVSLTQLAVWMKADEGEHLEFKEAKNRFDFEKLVQYCVALANERGGYMILGVTDKKPRRVVGTQAFENLERTKVGLLERLNLRVTVDALSHPDGRVLVFSVNIGKVFFCFMTHCGAISICAMTSIISLMVFLPGTFRLLTKRRFEKQCSMQ